MIDWTRKIKQRQLLELTWAKTFKPDPENSGDELFKQL